MPETPDPVPAARTRSWTRGVIWVLFTACAVLAIWLTVDHVQAQKLRTAKSLADARALAARAAATVDKFFREARHCADAIANDLSSGALAYTDLEARMRKECQARSDIDGIAVAFEPEVFAPGQRLYQEYLSQSPDGRLEILKGATYDYLLPPSDSVDRPKTAWYHVPFTRGPTWNEPFLATYAGRVLIEYGTRFTRRGDPSKFAGVVTLDFTLSTLRDLMARLDVGDNGYGVVCSSKGTLLSHPERDRVARESILEGEGTVDPRIREALRQALAGTSTAVDLPDPLTGQDVWVLSEPIPDTRGALALTLQQAEPVEEARRTAGRMTAVALAAGGALVALLALFVRVDRGSTAALWTVSNGFSAAAASMIVLLWVLAWDVHPSHGAPITSRVAVQHCVERHRASLTRTEELHVVPTGVEITAIRFPDAVSVLVGGNVWQRYADTVPATVRRGFVLPQHLSEEVILEEVERTRQGAEEVIVWRFVATLQQSFNPALFPFDRRDIAIYVEPAEVDANVILVPDLKAHPVLAPRALPGLRPGLGTNNWKIQESFYSTRVRPSSSLGLAVRESRPTVPTLQFNIAVRRRSVGPFIAYLLPALVAAGLAFAYLMTRRMGGSTEDLLTGLSYVAALFFVVVISHTALRESVAAVSITYLEHLFIVLYVMIALIVFDAFIVAHHPEWWLVRFRHHLPARLAYWPLITAALLVSTIAVFTTL